LHSNGFTPNDDIRRVLALLVDEMNGRLVDVEATAQLLLARAGRDERERGRIRAEADQYLDALVWAIERVVRVRDRIGE
jgi:hypothetical protein